MSFFFGDSSSQRKADTATGSDDDEDSPSLEALLAKPSTIHHTFHEVTEDDVSSLEEEDKRTQANRQINQIRHQPDPTWHTVAAPRQPRAALSVLGGAATFSAGLTLFLICMVVMAGVNSLTNPFPTPTPRARPAAAITPTQPANAVVRLQKPGACQEEHTVARIVACERYSYALAALAKHNLTSASGSLMTAVGWDAQFGDAYCLNALIDLMQGRSATTDFGQCAALDGAFYAVAGVPVTIYLKAAQQLVDEQHLTQALRLLDVIIKDLDRDNLAAHQMRARLNMRRSYQEQAISDWTWVINAHTTREADREAYLERGRLRYRLGDYDAALADFIWLFTYGEELPEAAARIGDIYYHYGSFERAEDWYDIYEALTGTIQPYMRARLDYLATQND